MTVSKDILQSEDLLPTAVLVASVHKVYQTFKISQGLTLLQILN